MGFLSLVIFPKRPLTIQDSHYESKVVPPLHVLVTSSQMTSSIGYFVLVDLGMYDVFVLNVNMFM